MHHSNRAFSLVELSIVLVILGLLTGGILTGQSLIRAAELRSVTVEYNNFQTAIMTFRDKYFALPGDMRNATAFWGNADTGGTGGACAAPLADSGTGTQTCNGNGDGNIDENGVRHERARFWQHLANAGLVEGSYTGIASNSNGHGCTVGINCPSSKVSQATWRYLSTGAQAAGTTQAWYEFRGGMVATFGRPTTSNGNAEAAAITPEEAWNVDTKIDDGRPAFGKVRTYRFNATDAWAAETDNCADNATEAIAEYNFSSTNLECAMIFLAD